MLGDQSIGEADMGRQRNEAEHKRKRREKMSRFSAKTVHTRAHKKTKQKKPTNSSKEIDLRNNSSN